MRLSFWCLGCIVAAVDEGIKECTVNQTPPEQMHRWEYLNIPAVLDRLMHIS